MSLSGWSNGISGTSWQDPVFRTKFLDLAPPKQHSGLKRGGRFTVQFERDFRDWSTGRRSSGGARGRHRFYQRSAEPACPCFLRQPRGFPEAGRLG